MPSTYFIVVRDDCSWEESTVLERCIYEATGRGATKIADLVCKALNREYRGHRNEPKFVVLPVKSLEHADVVRFKSHLKQLAKNIPNENSQNADRRHADFREKAMMFAAKTRPKPAIPRKTPTPMDGKRGVGEAGQADTGKKKRGRPSDTDLHLDKRIADAWDTGQYTSYAKLGEEFEKSGREVGLAVDRQRKRRKK